MNLKKFDSINVVPFIDVMLVLLVMVLITASFIQKSLIEVNLPTSSSNSHIEENKDKLIIIIDKNENIYLNDKKIKLDNFEYELKNFKVNTIIEFECDKDARFYRFVKILDILKKNQYKNLSIVTKNE